MIILYDVNLAHGTDREVEGEHITAITHMREIFEGGHSIWCSGTKVMVLESYAAYLTHWTESEVESDPRADPSVL